LTEVELLEKMKKLEEELIKIEESAKTKVSYIEQKINKEYDPKIDEALKRFELEQGKLHEILKILDECNVKKKELSASVNRFKKQLDDLKKEKEKKLKEKLKAINTEKTNKKKAVKKEVSKVEKEFKSLPSED